MSDDSKVPLPNLGGRRRRCRRSIPTALAHDDDSEHDRAAADLEAVFDVPVQVSAVLGRARMDVGELLKLGPGTRARARPQGRRGDRHLRQQPLVARGEVVLVEDKLGVTMTEVIKAEKELRKQ